jgi:hypothetical protein
LHQTGILSPTLNDAHFGGGDSEEAWDTHRIESDFTMEKEMKYNRLLITAKK